MAARLKKRKSIWYARVHDPARGTTVLVSTGCTDKKAAELRAAQLEREHVDPTYAAAHQTTVRDACESFAESRVARGRSEGTLHHYKVKLGHVVRLLPRTLAHVDAAACEAYLERRFQEGAAQTTIKKELRALGATLRHARRSGTYHRDPAMVIPELADTYRPRERFLTMAEFEMLKKHLRADRAAHVVLIVCTGARWSPSLAWQPGDVTRTKALIRGTKTAGSYRTVPIPKRLQKHVAWALRRCSFPLHPWSNVRHDLEAACKALKITHVTPNDLRRTFATWLRQRGVSPADIGLALGHTTSRMVERVYGRMGTEDLRAAMDHQQKESGQ